MLVVLSGFNTMAARRYHCDPSIRLDNRDKIVNVIPLVSNHVLAVISDYQRFRDVVSLTGGQINSEGITQSANRHMNFRTEATSTTA
jgi:hypothetical protein